MWQIRAFLGAVSCTVLVAIGAVSGALADSRTLTAVTSFDVKDWDPAIVYSNEVQTLLNVYDTLVHYDAETGDILPRLSTSWSVSDDGLTWEFKIREGVLFHDGTPLTADAVKQSFDRTIGMGMGGAYNWASVTDIAATDDHTLVIETSAPTSIDLIASAQYGAFVYSPKAAEMGTDWFMEGNAAGTGPYQVTQWVRGQQVVLERFPEYWGGWDGDEFDRVIFRIVEEVSTQIQMVRSGEADLIMSTAPADMLEVLGQEEGISVGVFDSWINLPMAINTGKYPTDNLKFRQALRYLVDHEAIASQIFSGYASVAHAPVPQSMWGAANFDVPGYDPARARQLLEESGIPETDWKVTYYVYTGRQEIRQVAELFQALAAQAGVSVEIQTGEWGVLWDKQKMQSTAAHLFALQFWPDYATPGSWLLLEYRSEDPVVFNFSYFKNPTFDAHLDEALALEASDRGQATELYLKAQKIVHDEVASIALVDLKRTVVYRSEIDGVSFSPAYETVFFHKLKRM